MFVCGFGNRLTDTAAYNAVGLLCVCLRLPCVCLRLPPSFLCVCLRGRMLLVSGDLPVPALLV